MEIKWEVQTRNYANGVDAILGKFKVGDVIWDSCSNDKNLKYKVSCSLPGLKTHLGNYKTEELAKERLITAIEYWFDKIK
jgi:hypothetical protein